MSTIKFNSKEAFVNELEARRPVLKAYDDSRRAEHEAKEQAWLEAARAKLRRVLDMDYEAIKEYLGSRYSPGVSLPQMPECPVLMETKLDKELRAVRITSGKVFNVSENGTWSEAHHLLTWDPSDRKTVC